MSNIIYDLVAIDCETSGLDSQKDEIVEVTAIEFNSFNQTGKVFTQLCKPLSGYIPANVTAINNITMDMVKDCPNYLTDGVREKLAEFVGRRPVVGHNIIQFDIKFIRINFRKALDTLEMCRAKYRGGNKLKSACKRLNIDWNDKEAHRSEYDVRKCIELYCKMVAIDEKENLKKQEAPLFAVPKDVREIYNNESGASIGSVDIDATNEIKLGIIPSKKDKEMFATQTYSYSRVNLFNQCPFKWYMQYVKGHREPDKEYFATGKICHKAAEWAGEWCYREQFKNKMEVFARQTDTRFKDEDINQVAKTYNKKYEEVTLIDMADYIWNNPSVISSMFDAKNLGSLIYLIDKTIPENSYERPSVPDIEAYNKIVEDAVNFYKCTSPDVIIDCRKIMSRFYALKDFSTTPGDLTLTEKRLVFDKDWKPLNDFYANNAFFRGILDVISYFGSYVVITDYKTSRKMMTLEQMKEDRQLMTYVLLVCKFLPEGSFSRIIVRIEYIRFGATVEYEINNPKEVADRALQWINSSIQSIEAEMLKMDGTAFVPKRNEYCHSCFLGEDGMCPLFNKAISGKLDDPFACSVSSIDECRAAWKRIETNKAETSRLAKLCKSFTEQCEDPVKIDGNAILDFYLTRYRDYDVVKTLNLLLGSKKVDIMDIVKYLSISPTDFKHLVEDKKIVITTEELNEISSVKSKSTFDAFTPEEAKGKGFVNS
jgi:DNA polymerase III epsilon subunit-like protein